MATTYGSGTAAFGLADESANGLYMADLALDASFEEAFVPNHVGDDVAVTLFNESGTLTASGVLAAADSMALTMLGKEANVANAAIYGTETTIDGFWIQSLNMRRANKEFETGGWTANGRSGIAASVITDST